jgi:hypothetical protein
MLAYNRLVDGFDANKGFGIKGCGGKDLSAATLTSLK